MAYNDLNKTEFLSKKVQKKEKKSKRELIKQLPELNGSFFFLSLVSACALGCWAVVVVVERFTRLMIAVGCWLAGWASCLVAGILLGGRSAGL